MNALVIGSKPGLLKHGEKAVMLFCCTDHGFAFVRISRKGLFAHDVKTVLQKIHGDGIMLVGKGGVDDEIDIVVVK